MTDQTELGRVKAMAREMAEALESMRDTGTTLATKATVLNAALEDQGKYHQKRLGVCDAVAAWIDVYPIPALTRWREYERGQP